MKPGQLGSLVIYSVRYAMHRSSYAPEEVRGIVREAWPDLLPADRDIVIRDVQAHIDGCAREGDGAAYGRDARRKEAEQWRTFLDWMRTS